MSRLKPGLWAVDRGSINAPYRNLWSGLEFMLPLFEQAGGQTHVLGGDADRFNRQQGVVPTAITSVTTDQGMAYDFPNDRFQLATSYVGPAQGTFLFVGSVDSGGSTSRVYGSHDAYEFVFNKSGSLFRAANNFYAAGGQVLNGPFTLTADVPHAVVATWDVATGILELYYDGVLVGSDPTRADDTPGSGTLWMGGRSATFFNGKALLVAQWDRVLEAGDIQLLQHDWFGMIRQSQWPNFPSVPTADGDITGTLAETLADHTSVATGVVWRIGSLAETLADHTSVASGESKIVGSSAETLADHTVVATGVVWRIGSLAETLADHTSAASGKIGVSGSVAETLADHTVVASGVVDIIQGSLAETLADHTVVAAGWTTVIGSLAETLDNVLTSQEFFLDLPGTSSHSASTPDHASLDITGDLEVITRLSADDYTPVGNQRIVDKVNAYNLIKLPGSDLRFEWHDGTSFLSEASSVTLDSVGIVDQQVIWLRATLDVDNGASDAEVKFFYSTNSTDDPTEVVWIQLGSTQLVGATTSIRTTTDDLFIGIESIGDGERWDGRIYRSQVNDGIGGTLVADFDGNDFAIGESDTDTAVDSTGKTWTINGDVSIILPDTGGQIGVSGTTTETLDDATSAAVGVVWRIGSLAETLADHTVVATGTVSEDITGTVNITLDAYTVVATGTISLIVPPGLTTSGPDQGHTHASQPATISSGEVSGVDGPTRPGGDQDQSRVGV